VSRNERERVCVINSRFSGGSPRIYAGGGAL
jgi:hypothetical protein